MNKSATTFLGGVCLGIVITLLVFKIQNQNKSGDYQKQKDQILRKQRDAFNNMNPFLKMQKQLGNFNKNSMSLSFGNLDSLKVKQREDDQNVYLEIDSKDIDQDSLNINIKNGIIQISGQIEKITKTKYGSSSFSSSFNESKQVPAGTDEAKVEITNSNNKIILKFPKK